MKGIGEIFKSPNGHKHHIYNAKDCTDLNDCILNIQHLEKLIKLNNDANKSTRKLYGKLIALKKRQQHFLNKETKANPNMEKELRAEIASALEKVTKANSPEVFHRLQTPAGYSKIEERIILSMIANQLTPAGIIPQLEQEFSLD